MTVTNASRKDEISARISWRKVPVFLGQFPLQQIRFTTGGMDESVIKKFKRKALRSQITRKAGQQVTRVQVRKNGLMFLPKGRTAGQKGFFYDKVTNVNGSKLKTNIYARMQRSTWSKGKRLPIENMYGVPVAYMAVNKDTLTVLKFDDKIQRLNRLITKWGLNA